MKSSRMRFWFSIVATVCGLCGSLFFIVLLKTDHSHQFWASLGFGSNGDSLNWCSNRVKSLSFPAEPGEALVEKAGKWIWEGKSTVELDYLSVEKWFAKYCQIPIKKIAFTDFDSPLVPLMEVAFVDGDTATFYDLGEKRIQLEEHIFLSDRFHDAFQELLKFGPHSQ